MRIYVRTTYAPKQSIGIAQKSFKSGEGRRGERGRGTGKGKRENRKGLRENGKRKRKKRKGQSEK